MSRACPVDSEYTAAIGLGSDLIPPLCSMVDEYARGKCPGEWSIASGDMVFTGSCACKDGIRCRGYKIIGPDETRVFTPAPVGVRHLFLTKAGTAAGVRLNCHYASEFPPARVPDVLLRIQRDGVILDTMCVCGKCPMGTDKFTGVVQNVHPRHVELLIRALDIAGFTPFYHDFNWRGTNYPRKDSLILVATGSCTLNQLGSLGVYCGENFLLLDATRREDRKRIAKMAPTFKWADPVGLTWPE